MRASPVFFASVSLSALALSACGWKSASSRPQEGMDPANSILGFGLDGTMTWDEIRAVESGNLEWLEEPYFPGLDHVNAGIAARPKAWEALAPAERNFGRPLQTMIAQYQSFLAALPNGRADLMTTANLSPGEKFDLLTLGTPNPIPAALLKEMAAADGSERFPEFSKALDDAFVLEQEWSALSGVLADEYDAFRLRTNGQATEEEEKEFLAQLAPRVAPLVENLRITRSEEDPGYILVWKPEVLERVQSIRARMDEAVQALDWERFNRASAELAEFQPVWGAENRLWETVWATDATEESRAAAFEAFLKARPEFSGVRIFERGSWLDYDNTPLGDEQWKAVQDALRAHGKAFGASRMAMASRLQRYLPVTASGWKNWGRTYAEGDFAYAGHCHGASLAATRMKTPKHFVKTRAGTGGEVMFSPHDLKSLASLAWSDQAEGTFRYAGVRCNLLEEQVTKDANGRPVEVECRDLNPGVFHMALVEKVAKKNESMVIEQAQFDQIWNSPVREFSVKYEPIPLRNGSESEPGEPVSVADVDDGRAVYRSPETRFLVNVTTTVGYTDYRYTLELDADRRIVGGEWGPFVTSEGMATRDLTQETHPDFLWYLDSSGRLGEGLISPRILNRLFECATQETPTGDSPLWFVQAEEPKTYVECDLAH